MKLKHQQLLSKSKFKLSLDCEKQVYYYNNRNLYSDKDVEDDFMKSLAKGGFQVGELAKAYYPEGIEIDGTFDPYELIEKTNKELQKENVILFEPAFLFKNLFVRVDILVKTGNKIQLIEVKAKSIQEKWFDDLSNEDIFKEHLDNRSYDGIVNKTMMFAKEGTRREIKINAEWMPYVYDIAFQTYVVSKSFPNFDISSFLCCPDQNKQANVDGLNQKFMVYDENKQSKIKIIGNVSRETLGDSILSTVNVDWLVKAILNNKEKSLSENFEDKIYRVADICLNNEKPEFEISSICKNCRFNYKQENKINGFEECLQEKFDIKPHEYEENNSILEIWNFKPNTLLNSDPPIFFVDELSEESFPMNQMPIAPLNQFHRQLLQVQKIKMKDQTEFLAINSLKKELMSFKYPLHFIDFETSMVALPFNKGEKPYKTIAFQFSHHIITKEGRVKHIGQFIDLDRENPNLAFIRELKKQLSHDDGTIFRWSNHENTVLLYIESQLKLLDDTVSDKNELIEFIRSITTNKHTGLSGERTMIDMWDLYKKFHYMPETKGSNSIKAVLPAITGRFHYLQDVLSEPVYGKNLEFTSLNFEDMAWFQKDENGKLKDPYSLLPTIFDEYDREQIDLLFADDDLKNGGTAMMAYAVCQFKMITNYEKEKIKNALLRYCELDTFAMVIVYLYWCYQCGLMEES